MGHLLRCLALLFAAAPGLQGQGDEIVKEFNQYFRQYKDTATRVEAVLSLEGTESSKVVEALVPVLKQGEPEVVRAAVRVLSRFKTQPPVEALFAQIAESKDDALRALLVEAVSQGRYPGSGAFLSTLLSSRNWTLRRRVLEALAVGAEPEAAQWIAPLCQDPEPAVRCTALECLGKLKSELGVRAAIPALEDPVWQVRWSAIEALRSVRHRDAVGPLIERLETEQGRLTRDIAFALQDLTGREYGQEVAEWKKFWGEAKGYFQVPSLEDLRRRKERPKEGTFVASTTHHALPGVTTFTGIDTPSRAMIFVIDVSGSMENLVVEKERFQDGGYPSLLRIDIVKTELIRTLERLESHVRFNVISFATDVRHWKKDLVPANVLNKSSAIDWVRRLEAVGGASRDDLAAVGLVGAANLGAGKTNTFGALMAGLDAMGATGPRTGDKDYQVDVDTVFFLSDGRPSTGEYVDTSDILREVLEANALRKVVVHTIAIGEFQKDFMKQLAEQNGGVFVDLGR